MIRVILDFSRLTFVTSKHNKIYKILKERKQELKISHLTKQGFKFTGYIQQITPCKDLGNIVPITSWVHFYRQRTGREF